MESKWIKATPETMPKGDKHGNVVPVIIWCKQWLREYARPEPAYYDPVGKRWLEYKDNDVEIDYTVTHYQYFDSPPKQ